MWYVYALYSKSVNRIYIGVTGDLRKRIRDHVSGKTKTTSRMPGVELVYYEACIAKEDAMDRERQLKTGFGRGYLRKRINYYLMRS